MRSRFGLATGALTLALLAGTPAPGWAQGALGGSGGSVGVGSQPFQFRTPSLGGGPGMSSSYRQAILEAELNNRRPSNMIRTPDGGILEVERRSGQAFVRTTPQQFVIPAYGIGIGGGGGGLGLRFSGASIGSWTGFLYGDGLGPSGMPDRFIAVSGYGGNAINEWIMLL